MRRISRVLCQRTVVSCSSIERWRSGRTGAGSETPRPFTILSDGSGMGHHKRVMSGHSVHLRIKTPLMGLLHTKRVRADRSKAFPRVLATESCVWGRGDGMIPLEISFEDATEPQRDRKSVVEGK